MHGPIDWSNPINNQHQLSRNMELWLIAVPNSTTGYGTGEWRDIADRNTGAITSASWVGPQGRVGGSGAMEFAGGTEYVDLGTQPWGTDRPLSVFAWIKTSQVSCDVIVNWNAAVNGLWFGVGIYEATDSKIAFWSTTWASGNTSVDDGEWHHIGATTDGNGNGEFWLDGMGDGTFTGHATTSDGTNNARIGNSFSFPPQFIGHMDSVQLYNNRQLIAPEVKQLYDISKRGFPGLLNRRKLSYYLPVAAVGGGGLSDPLNGGLLVGGGDQIHFGGLVV